MEIQNSIFNYATLLKQVKARVALAQVLRQIWWYFFYCE